MDIGGLVKVSDIHVTRAIAGDKSGTARVHTLETSDGLRAEVEIREFVDGSKELRLTEFLSPPPPKYEHLNRNGSMTVQVQEDGSWVVLLRALRLGGKDYPTLNYVTWEELSEICELDFNAYLMSLGFQTGTWEELNSKAAKFKDSLAVGIPGDRTELLFLPWAATRVVALMKRLGRSALDTK